MRYRVHYINLIYFKVRIAIYTAAKFLNCFLQGEIGIYSENVIFYNGVNIFDLGIGNNKHSL